MTTSTEHHSLKLEVSDAGIATIWLDAGDRKVVVLDRSLIHRLNVTLEQLEAEANSDTKGLMLRSDCDRVFVAGADLAEIDALDDQGLHAYLAFGTTVFGKIAALPYPTVALIQGAALGGGLEIAMHCDGLIISKYNEAGKPYPIGLPEASLGICPGWGGTQLLPARMDSTKAIHMTATGATFLSDNLPEGLGNVVVDSPDQLETEALLWLQSHTKTQTIPTSISPANGKKYEEALTDARECTKVTEAAGAVFEAVKTGISGGWTAGVAVEQCELVSLRNTQTARAKLDAFLSKG